MEIRTKTCCTLALALAMSFPLNAAEYSLLPVEGSAIVSADGSTFSMEVIDTNYQRGTFNISLLDGAFESYVGNRAISGFAEGDLSEVELPAVRNASDVVAWNQRSDDGGGHQVQSRGRGSHKGGEIDVQWRFVVRAVQRYCAAAGRHAAAAISAAAASCAAGGGTHSGGSLGVCGIGADTGECYRPPVMK